MKELRYKENYLDEGIVKYPFMSVVDWAYMQM